MVEVYAVTDVGRTRDHNEDAFLVSDLSDRAALDFDASVQQRVGARGLLFMVADGMGGAAAGELASATAVDVVLRSLRDDWSAAAPGAPELFVDAIERAAQTANSVIYRYATDHPEVRGMGTTATIAGLLAIPCSSPRSATPGPTSSATVSPVSSPRISRLSRNWSKPVR
ncbi:MAG: protein phosphatase 2C domain-containing protein [Gemmatimonadetes bacterium]|nr:protein phosphatase 2C domain-containing protein [Gemmatimonadota bacterium]